MKTYLANKDQFSKIESEETGFLFWTEKYGLREANKRCKLKVSIKEIVEANKQ